MKKLGIIGAMQVEVETLLGCMGEKEAREIAGSVFYEGILEGLPVVVVQCGVGKVNAAICAQILCSCYGVTHLVNTGIAGSLCAELDIGDLVVSKDAMHHDFDCCAFGYPMGKVPDVDVIALGIDQYTGFVFETISVDLYKFPGGFYCKGPQTGLTVRQFQRKQPPQQA